TLHFIDRAADHSRIATKTPHPQRMADHNHTAARHEIPVFETRCRAVAAEQWSDAEHAEEVWRHQRAGDAFRHSSTGEAQLAPVKSGDALERAALCLIQDDVRLRRSARTEARRGRQVSNSDKSFRVWIR